MEKNESMKERKHITFDKSLFKFLQSVMFTKLLALCTDCARIPLLPWNVCFHPVTMERFDQYGVCQYVKQDCQTMNFKVEVNSFFGWAISDVHCSMVQGLAKDEDSNEGLQAQIDFVSAMQYFGHQAALNDACLRDCYDGIFQFMNCGGLTLVSPEYFESGKSLMQVIVNALDSCN